MSLESTIKELKALKPFVEEDVESGPAETLSGRRGRKNQAIEQTKELRRRYVLELIDSAVFIVVCGSERSNFETIATGEKFNLFSVDPEYFYHDLANRVHPSNYKGRASAGDLFDIVGRHLEDKMNELGLNEYNQMVFRETYIEDIQNVEQFTELLKRAINEQVGSEIVGVQSINLIVDKAIASGYSSRTTPIVLNTQDEKLATDLLKDLTRLTKCVFLVNAGKTTKKMKSVEDAINVKEVTDESVKSTLDTIIKSIKR